MVFIDIFRPICYNTLYDFGNNAACSRGKKGDKMKNRCKAAVLTLVLASMIASGCGQTNIQTNTESPAPAAETEAAVQDNGGSGDETASRDGGESDKAEAKAYLEALKDPFHEYANSSYSLSDDLEAYRFDAALNDLNNMETALSHLESVSAPAIFAEQQKKLCGTLPSEREYIDNCRKFIGYCKKGDALTEDDKKEVQKINEALDSAEGEFAQVYLETVKAVKAEIEK